jgi:hypothetical protein
MMASIRMDYPRGKWSGSAWIWVLANDTSTMARGWVLLIHSSDLKT